ncbi:group II intron reverse transcriptase/maturase [Parashewanella spongiae]|uniref:group II intron reverse transcriptase/maturase n=1 Tax=Parashewanella spongiae TaxID=342950 RepID=UPI0010596C57|nr:group II intron reverse transcriptase/maturase [Parashewanella spongiae]
MANTPVNIRILQRKLYLRSKLNSELRFYSLYDKLSRLDILEEAYRRCKTNKGGAGIDGITFIYLEQQKKVVALLKEIQTQLQQKNYRPSPVKRVEILKDNGKTRKLGIPIISDRIVQMAMTIVMQPVYEPHLHEHSYGYRPCRSAQQAVKVIEMSLKQGYQHVLDADLSAYFDTIPHAKLMTKIERRISDSSFLSLLKSFIKAPISIETVNGKWRIEASRCGTPQGGVISPLLANIYLNDFCLKIHEKTPCKIVTYADDFVVLHKQTYTQEQLDWIAQQLSDEGLKLNQSKTHCVDMGKLMNEFDFLGFNFQRITGLIKGTSYIKIQASKKSQTKLKNKLRDIVKHRTSNTLGVQINKVNQVLRGWKHYFAGIGYPRGVFFRINGVVVNRFYRWYRRLSQRRSKYLSRGAYEKLRQAGLEYLPTTR